MGKATSSKKTASPAPTVAPPPASVPPARPPGFRAFLRQPAQRPDLWLLGGGYVLLYALVHYCYPYPLITEDSPNYVHCALINLYGGFRPMGYSWFLQWFHALSTRIVFVGAAQYWIYALAVSYFLLTVKYFFPPRRRWLFYLFALGTMLSPVALYLTHWLMSDSLFAALTLVWLSSGLWLLQRVSWVVAALHVAAMVLAIQVRFVGLFYPLFTLLGLAWAHRGQGRALVVSAAALFGAYMVYHNVKRDTYRIYGVDSFSGFSGWAAANNATAILPYIKLAPEALAFDPELAMTHRILTALPDTAYSEGRVVHTSFIWSKAFGGKQVLQQVLPGFPGNYPGAWIYTGELLGRYAGYLVRHYPLEYGRYFLWMNLRNTLHPVRMILFPQYREVPVNAVFTRYYDVDGVERFTARYDFVAQYIQALLGPSALVLWVLVGLGALLVLLRRRALAFTPAQRRATGWLLGFMLAYLGASLIAHPVHLRYLLPIHGTQLFVLYLAVQALLPARAVAATPPADLA